MSDPWSASGWSAGGRHRGDDAAAYLLGEVHCHGYLHRFGQMSGDEGGQVLGEDSTTIEGAQVELQRPGLDAHGDGYVLDLDRVEVRLVGDRAGGCQLRGVEVDEVKRALNPEGVDLVAGGRIRPAQHGFGHVWSPVGPLEAGPGESFSCCGPGWACDRGWPSCDGPRPSACWCALTCP